MKRTFKKTLTLVMVIITVFCSITTIAYAAVSVISKVSTEKIADLVEDIADGSGTNNTAVGGIATGKSKHSMFVLKGNSRTQQHALFFYFPDMDNKNKYGVYRLRHAGHGNAMTVDRTNIFVAGWVSGDDYEQTGNQANNKYNNWILMIPRSTIADMGLTKTGKQIPKDDKSTEEVEGFTVLYPKVKNVASDGTVTYSDYKKRIASITKYNEDGVFLIGYTSDLGDDYLTYRKAQLEKYNGQTLFVVSENPDDVFVIKNTASYKDAVGQDMCYSPNCGLFIPRWYGGDKENENYNPLKNVILWADIDGEYTTMTKDNVTYKVYTPIKINVNKYKESDTYSQFEIESIAFQADDTMIFSCNTLDADSKQADGVYKLHCNETLATDGKFTKENFAKFKE